MPNWVKHTFTVRGAAADVQAFRDAVRRDAAPGERERDASDFSFRRILPMPEELNVDDSSDGKMGMAALTGDGVSSHISYVEHFGKKTISTREELHDWLKANRPEALELGQRYLDNLAKYGVATWYGWANEQWGTKWDACDVNLTELPDGSLQYYIETAWSFPEPVFTKLAEMFPLVVVVGTEDEEGGWFYGEFTLRDGTLTKAFQEGTRKGGPYDYGDEDDEEADGDDAANG